MAVETHTKTEKHGNDYDDNTHTKTKSPSPPLWCRVVLSDCPILKKGRDFFCRRGVRPDDVEEDGPSVPSRLLAPHTQQGRPKTLCRCIGGPREERGPNETMTFGMAFHRTNPPVKIFITGVYWLYWIGIWTFIAHYVKTVVRWRCHAQLLNDSPKMWLLGHLHSHCCCFCWLCQIWMI
jgi:hypothetical protein